MILSENITPEDIKRLDINGKYQLCAEIRSFLIDSIPKTGGHLASNLGTVELTVALHSVFSTPTDKIVFDVGHQSYTHKILTGRYKGFSSLRCADGISGFPRNTESEHDAFIGGHSSISISAALGIAKAMELEGKSGNVIAVIGDGALTGGQAFEGLNNVGKLSKNLIIVLNDNEMSISKNHGVVADYLTKMRSSKFYIDKKEAVKEFLSHSEVGKDISKSLGGTKDLIKFAFYQSNIFEALGLKYYGPVNGHQLEKLIEIFEIARDSNQPCIVHVKTKKGKGYVPAEENSGEYHGVSKKTVKKSSCLTYSEVMGRELYRLAALDERIFAVTAAMKYATGLQYIAKSFPERFADAGIAEQHALTFCCGLATQGIIPVFAVYSTFLQRCYDQIIHDASIEKKHIVLCVDRAGLVGEDGETHQGVFDVAMLSSIPDMVIYSPCDASSLRFCLNEAVYNNNGVVAVRYPRGYSIDEGRQDYSDYEHSGKNSDTLLISYGREANLIKGIANTDSLSLTKILPINEDIISIALSYKRIFFFEEGIKSGGIGEKLLCRLFSEGFRGDYEIVAVEDRFVKAADVEAQLSEFGLDRKSIEERVKNSGRKADI